MKIAISLRLFVGVVGGFTACLAANSVVAQPFQGVDSRLDSSLIRVNWQEEAGAYGQKRPVIMERRAAGNSQVADAKGADPRISQLQMLKMTVLQLQDQGFVEEAEFISQRAQQLENQLSTRHFSEETQVLVHELRQLRSEIMKLREEVADFQLTLQDRRNSQEHRAAAAPTSTDPLANHPLRSAQNDLPLNVKPRIPLEKLDEPVTRGAEPLYWEPIGVSPYVHPSRSRVNQSELEFELVPISPKQEPRVPQPYSTTEAP